VWSRVRIGNNDYSGHPVDRSVLSVGGDEIAEFSTTPAGELMVSLRLFEPRGAVVGEFRRNVWVGRQREFEYARSPHRLVVRRVAGGNRTAVFDVSLHAGAGELWLRFANLYTPRRHELIVDPDIGILLRDPVQVRVLQSLSDAYVEQALDAIEVGAGRDSFTGTR